MWFLCTPQTTRLISGENAGLQQVRSITQEGAKGFGTALEILPQA